MTGDDGGDDGAGSGMAAATAIETATASPVAIRSSVYIYVVCFWCSPLLNVYFGFRLR